MEVLALLYVQYFLLMSILYISLVKIELKVALHCKITVVLHKH